MNPVMKIILASVDFVLIYASLSLGGMDIYSILWYLICIGLGFGLRVAVLVQDGKYTPKVLMIHVAFTICWTFLMILLWRTWVYGTWINQGGNSFEIYLFINALFSVYMVGQFDHFFKLGFRGWLRLNAGKILAKDDREDNS